MAVATVTSVTPSTSTTIGTKTATVVGTGFVGVTGVKVGGVSAQFTVTDATHISLVLPAHASGAAKVVVTNADGPSLENVNVTYSSSYTEEAGDDTGKKFFYDIEISPANLKNGELRERFDPILYPSRGRTGVAKVGRT